MTSTTNLNEQIKRSFFEYLKGAEGYAESSVRSMAGAIWQWQLFLPDKGFDVFDRTKAIAFTEWLEKRPSKTKSGRLSVVSRGNYLRRVKGFFEWLSSQPGFKSKILRSDVEFLRLSNVDAQTARCGTTRQVPTLEEVKKIIENITGRDEIAMRDRAMISLALITGMRVSAIVSLKMKSYDEQGKKFDQNPGDGVRTKNAKRIFTTFFPIDWSNAETYIVEWYQYLKTKGFGPEDPIFPASASGFSNNQSEDSIRSIGTKPWSAAGAARTVFQKRCAEASVPYFNPHSFRHLIVSILYKISLTEEQKKAISLNLGHAHVNTTFGSYGGYGNMSSDTAIGVVQKMGDDLSRKKREGKLSVADLEVLKRIVNSLD